MMRLPCLLRMLLVLWITGCEQPQWTAEGALAVHRAALDTDRDGRVSAAEYDRTRWQGPPFASADADNDGDLSASELLVLFQSQSPTSFDGATAPESARLGGQSWSLAPRQQCVWEVLVWMSDALGHAGQAVPDPVLIDTAVLSGDIESPASRRVLAQLQPAWVAQGWAWPEGLPAADPSAPPERATAPAGTDPSAAVTARIRANLAELRGNYRSDAAPSNGSPGVQ
jgi:hypothetical protein